MQIALMHSHFSGSHLEKVKSEMIDLGAPTIKAVWMECWGVWAALEGCHRIRAAYDLGFYPEIEEVEYSEDLFLSEVGVINDDDYKICEIADKANAATIINFED